MKALDDIEARWKLADERIQQHAQDGYIDDLIKDSLDDVPQLVKALRAVLELPMYTTGDQTSRDDACRASNRNTVLIEMAGAIESALNPRPQITNKQVEAVAVAISHAVRGTDLRYLNKFDADYVRSVGREALEAAAEVGL